MNRIGVICMFCLVLVACSQNQPESKTYSIVTESNSSKKEDRKIKATVTETQIDKGEKERQSDGKKKTIRFIEPPQVVSDPSDPSYSLREPYGDLGDPVVGMEEPIAVQEPPQEEILQYAEEMPEYPGGTQALMDYLKANIKYPAQVKDEGVQGTVYIAFVVFKDGTLGNFKIRRGIHQDLDKEAMSVLKAMPKWKPGKQNGKAVNCQMTLPVKFRLE